MFDYNYQVNAIVNNQQMLNTHFTNLQNQFTPGYKARSIDFTDVMGQTASGKSAKVQSSGIIFTQGAIAKTSTPTDLAVNGNGFFTLFDGRRLHYSRDGRFRWKDGALTHPSGMKLMGFPLDIHGNIAGKMGPIQMSMDPNSVLFGGRYMNYRFDEAGKLYGETTVIDPLTKQAVTTTTPLYQVALSAFANPSGLSMTSNTTYSASKSSGAGVVGVAGQGALGQIVPQSLEMSNVDFAQQAAAIGMTRQNYEANFAAFRSMNRLTEDAIRLVR
ncbi:MAG: flagellar hook basal-body protein [Candidatus Eremiobacteraeota bacterium]|nr:flagellar hook basal-body protein [Candidatus Eremiobacteraeota bacterium]